MLNKWNNTKDNEEEKTEQSEGAQEAKDDAVIGITQCIKFLQKYCIQ